MYVAENRVVETKENAMNNISRNHKLLEERRIQFIQKTLFLIAINAASDDLSPTYKNYKTLIEKSNFLEHLKYNIEFHFLIQL